MNENKNQSIKEKYYFKVRPKMDDVTTETNRDIYSMIIKKEKPKDSTKKVETIKNIQEIIYLKKLSIKKNILTS